MEKLVHKTWLLDGMFHSAPGLLVLEGERLSFLLVDIGTFSEERLSKFESFRKLKDSYSKLCNGEVIEIVSCDLNSIQASFPWYTMKGGATLSFKGLDQKLKLSFMQPQNTKFPTHKLDSSLLQVMALSEGVSDLKSGIAFGKKFKDIMSHMNT